MKLGALLLPLLAAAATASRAPRPAGGRGAALRPNQDSLLSVALDAAVSAASDAEVGSDLDAVQGESGSSADGSPKNLEQYCKGGSEAGAVGQDVRADWMGMGERYPGKVKDKNKDGTVDIAYDDGFDELNVPLNRIKVDEEETQIDPKSDPACQLQETTKDLKKKVVEVRKKVGKWIEEKTAALAEAGVVKKKGEGDKAGDGAKGAKGDNKGKGKGGKGTGKDPDKASGNATKAQSEELERLKEQLDEKDGEIAELEKDLSEADDAIEEEAGQDSGPMSVDDLIAMYKARIDRRNKRIEELKGKVERRKQKLEEIRDPKTDKKDRTTVEDISKEVQELGKEIDKAREKRARLVAEGTMDIELGHALEGLFKMQEQLEAQLRELERLQNRVQERKEAARRAAKKAEAEAREAAEKAGDDPSTVEEKARKAREEANKEAEALDAELLMKARDVSKDLEAVSKSTQELDSGILPHGDKWWRYRYEHAYVEAVLMTFVCLLMLIWERVYQYMRWKVRDLSNAEDDNKITHGTMYIGWLEFLAGELMTSLLVFLTCWVLAECHAFEVFPVLLQETKHLHLPKKSYEYRRLSLDVCVVFFFSIIFYFIVTLSVVHSCTKKLENWAAYEEELQERVTASPTRTPSRTPSIGGDMAEAAAAEVAQTPPKRNVTRSETLGARNSSRQMRLQKAQLAKFLPQMTLMGKDTMEAKENYNKLKGYFFDKVQDEPALLQAMQDENVVFTRDTFPFWIYLRLAVRRNSDKLFQFGLPVWACLMATFVTLMFLHRFAHMGCVKVMVAVVIALMGLLLLMVWWINKICARVMMYTPKDERGSGETTPREGDIYRSLHQRFSTEEGVINILHILLFFVCYLAARMICQPWMWRLHFYMVLSLTIMLMLLGTCFVFMVSPMIPDFCVALAMPPYVDPSDVKTMMEAIELGEDMDDSELEEAVMRPQDMRARKSVTAKF